MSRNSLTARSVAHRAVVIAITVLMVTSVVTSPLLLNPEDPDHSGVASADTNNSTTIADYENIATFNDSGKNGWEFSTTNWNNSGGLDEAELTSNSLSGDTSIKMHSTDLADGAIVYKGSEVTPDRIGFEVMIPEDTNDGSYIRVDLSDGSGNPFANVWLYYDGDQTIDPEGGTDGGTAHTVDWDEGQKHYVEFTNISWSQEKFTVRVDGASLGRYNFYPNSVNGFGEISIKTDANNDGVADINAYVDDIEYSDGSRDASFYSDISSDHTEDFEDGQSTASGQWVNWSGPGASSIESATYNGQSAIEGSESAYWDSGASTDFYFYRDNDYDTDLQGNVSWKWRFDGAMGYSGDGYTFKLESTTRRATFAGMKWKYDGTVDFFDNGSTVNRNVGWSAGTVYNITYVNHFDNQTYEVIINGAKYGPFGSRTNVQTYDHFTVSTDHSGSSGSKPSTFDSFEFNTPAPPSTSGISGTVVDQNGNPVAGAKVTGFVAEYGSVDTSRDKIQEFADPIPDAWEEQGKTDVQLLGSDGEFTTSDTYVASHTQDAIPSTAPWIDNPDLTGSSLRLQLPADEPVILSAWDGDASGVGVNTCIPGFGSEYNCQLPGTHKEDAQIVIERIDGKGDVVNRDVVSTTEVSGEGFGDPDQFHYAEVTFESPGFYRFYEKGTSNKGPIRVVGSPTAIASNAIQNVNDTLSEQSQALDDAINNNKVSTISTTTNKDGTYTLSPPNGAKIVLVQAIKAPGLDSVSTSELDIQTVTQEYNSALTTSPEQRTEEMRTLLNSSLYLPSQTRTVRPPAANVRITMHELSSPPGANVTALQDRLEELRNRLNNLSWTELPPALQQRLRDLQSPELRDLYDELDRLRERNDRLDERYRELLEQSDAIDNPQVGADPDELTDEQLRARIQALQQSLTELQSTIETGPGTITRDANTVTYRQRFGAPLDPEDVSVVAHWSNGTSQIVDDKYISIDGDLENIAGQGGSEVLVSDYPIGENDPASLSFEVLGVTETGIGEATKQVTNPTYSGTLPTFQSISLSSMAPGPNQDVTMKVNPGDGTIQSIDSFTVYGPDGSEVASGSPGARSTNFSVAGTGVHTVRGTFVDAEGTQVTTTWRMNVGKTDQNRRPTIRAKESPLGVFALVGDGLSNGQVKVAQGGAETTIVAQLEADAEVPSHIDVHTESLSLAPDADTTVRVVRGENQEAVNHHVRVTIHGKRVPDDALLWRNDAPLQIGSETKAGTVTETGKGLSIQTYTDGSGVVTIKTQTDPSILDQIEWQIETRTGIDVGLPSLTAAPVAPDAAGATPAGVSA